MRTTSVGSSASRDGGSAKEASSRPIHSSNSARRALRSASDAEQAIGKLSERTRAESTVIRRASTVSPPNSSSSAVSRHFRARGSSVSWPRVKAMSSASRCSAATSSPGSISATGRPPRGTKRSWPPVSTPSKAKNRASGSIEARALSRPLTV